MNRRNFLAGSAALMGALGLPLAGRAAVSASDRKFVFVFAEGGWDPTRVFAPEFANPNVDMEPDAERATSGGIAWVDHPNRPSVRAFMEQHYARMLLLNGVLVRSIAHEICTMIAMTGDSSGLRPDWPALLATLGAGSTGFTVPHLVLGGPSFPGPLGSSVARTGAAGQLEGLVSGAIVDQSDAPNGGLPLPTQNIVDSFALRRARGQAAKVVGGNAGALYAAFSEATASASELKDLRYTMDFTAGATLAEQTEVAADALAIGMCRCVSLTGGGGWDSHDTNDPIQSERFESLFSGLNQLMEVLAGTPGTAGGTLADETMVVVLSEMGRTPKLNGFAGKDHWPYTSVMLVGDGVTGNRIVGAYDDLYYGRPVDPGSGEIDDAGPQLLSAEAVGATLLALADIDPKDHIQGVEPLTGVLS